MAESAVRPTLGESLVARGVTKHFGGLQAVDSVSLELKRGEILGLIGPNGSGKTTFINVVTGHLPITAGEVWVGSTNVTGWPAHRVPYVGVARTYQLVRLFKNLTVLENVEVAAVSVGGLPRMRARERAWGALERMGISHRAASPARALTYGEQRVLEIARALATHPTFLLLDEPGAGLNDAEIETLLGILARLPEDIDCGMLVVDHDMRLIMRLCNRIHVLDHGRTIAEGTPEEVRSHPEVKVAYLGSASLEI